MSQFIYIVQGLKEKADIVCTNPPFSNWKLVIESGKKFIIPIFNGVMKCSTFRSIIPIEANKENLPVCLSKKR